MPDYRKAIRRAARRYGVDPGILTAQIRAESGFDPHARSPKGAQGIAQFIPSTAKQYGVNLNDNRVSDDIDGAARYMRDNLRRTGGNYHQALSIYNSGRPDGYKHIPETRAYVAKILSQAGGGSKSRPSDAAHGPSAGTGPRYGTQTIPGVDRSADRTQAKLAYLDDRHNPDALLNLASSLKDAQDTPSSTKRVRLPNQAPTGTSLGPQQSTKGGVAHFEGKRVAAWIKPALAYARQHGWQGQVVSGYRSKAEQAKIYNSGIRPAAKPGTSNHEGTEFPRGAIDVSDAETLARILHGTKYGQRLKWAGAKDPVHFSHPHGGSY